MDGKIPDPPKARIGGPERDKVRDLRAARLRALRLSYLQIADELGYANESGAWKAVQRGMALTVREPHQDMILLDLAELDEMAREAWKVLRNTHYTVDRGEVVHLDGRPLLDDAPVLAAIGRLLDIQVRRARLVGLDAPKRVEVSDALPDLDAAIRDLAAEFALRGEGSEVPVE